MLLTNSEVVIYHDETREIPKTNLKGHVLFFVPIKIKLEDELPLFKKTVSEIFPKIMLVDRILQYRKQYNCDGKLHFTDISGKKWGKYDRAYYDIASVAIDALRSKRSVFFKIPLRCKLAIIFYPKGTDRYIYGGTSINEKELRHDETLLRILLKGACHYLYNENNKVRVIKIIADGEPGIRHFDEKRIIWRLLFRENDKEAPLREYVSLDSNCTIEHLQSDHKKHDIYSEDYIDANLLQIADLLLGSAIRSCFTGKFENKTIPEFGDLCSKKDVISTPFREMIEKKKIRGSNFINSGHYRSFTLTKVEFSSKHIIFQELEPLRILNNDLNGLLFADK